MPVYSQRVCHRVMTISINCKSAGDLSRWRLFVLEIETNLSVSTCLPFLAPRTRLPVVTKWLPWEKKNLKKKKKHSICLWQTCIAIKNNDIFRHSSNMGVDQKSQVRLLLLPIRHLCWFGRQLTTTRGIYVSKNYYYFNKNNIVWYYNNNRLDNCTEIFIVVGQVKLKIVDKI
jgi:hypothetical protein